METKELATIMFSDGDSGEPTVAVVRQCDSNIGLALSIQGNGDLEVFLDVASARKLIHAITQGIAMIERSI
jgi:hypothetical protein